MNSFRRTVSAEAMQSEWTEIQAAQADPAMFRPLYNRYFEQIFNFVYKRTLNEELCSDIVSQVFLKAMQRLDGYTFQGVPFSAWLFRIATNNTIDFIRKKKLDTFSLNTSLKNDDGDNVNIDLEDKNLDPQEEAIKVQKIELVHLFVGKLPPKYQRLVRLRYFEELSYDEIATERLASRKQKKRHAA